MVYPISPCGLVGVHSYHAPVPAVPPGGEGVHRAGLGAGFFTTGAGEVVFRQILFESLQVSPDRPEPDSQAVARDKGEVVHPHPPVPRQRGRRIFEVYPTVTDLVGYETGPEPILVV